MSDQTIVKADTFTCSYNEQEDRLLLTINYQDIMRRVDFWITRSFLIKLLPYLFEYKTYNIESESNLNADKSIQNITPTDTSTFVLMSKEPILLDSVDFQKLDNAMKIVFKNREKKINAVGIFDNKLLVNVISLILNAVPSYEWGIDKNI